MPKKKKTVGELEAKDRISEIRILSETVASVVNRLIGWGGSVLIARYVFMSIEVLAGCIL